MARVKMMVLSVVVGALWSVEIDLVLLEWQVLRL
jgi:hypothetical protein